MKLKATLPFLTIILACACTESASAQIFDRIKNQAKIRTASRIINMAGKATDKALDKVEDAGKNATKANTSSSYEQTAKATETAAPSAKSTSAKATASYANYDFVPGDKIIFQPDLSSEPDMELPARFAIKKGNVEIQTHEGEKILHLNKGGYTIIAPLMDKADYLPEQFTLEFDMMYENDKNYFAYVNDFSVQLNKSGDENFNDHGVGVFSIRSNSSVILGPYRSSATQVPDKVKEALNTNDLWHHVALYVRKNIAKAYINGTRVAATNNFEPGATKLAIKTDGRYGFKIKNFRLAGGGDDKYNKIVTEGKFITHGILFDVNKSTIKDESMGALNEIVKLMKDHGDLKFEINGHTDSDGKADANLKLSEDRAIAVKDKLVAMGISADRLTTKGNGATKPIDSNSTQEGKANNRRVEFVKI